MGPGRGQVSTCPFHESGMAQGQPPGRSGSQRQLQPEQHTPMVNVLILKSKWVHSALCVFPNSSRDLVQPSLCFRRESYACPTPQPFVVFLVLPGILIIVIHVVELTLHLPLTFPKLWKIYITLHTLQAFLAYSYKFKHRISVQWRQQATAPAESHYVGRIGSSNQY